MSEKTAADQEARRAARDQSEQGQPDDKPPENAQSDAPADTAPGKNDDAEESAGPDPLAEAQARAEDNWNQYLRAVAELENTRKRAARDVEQARRFAIERFAADLLAVKDSLEMGLNAAADAQDKAGALVEGTEMTLKQLAQVFEKFGIAEIDPKGEKFDPELHEAMATQPSAEADPDTVLTVVQKGYLLNGRMLRAARVLVARQPEDDEGKE